VERHEMLLAGRHVVFRIDRADRALGLAQGAVDALDRIDHQEVRALVEAVDRAHLDAVGVLPLDAVLGDDEGHSGWYHRVGTGTPMILEHSRAFRCEAFASIVPTVCCGGGDRCAMPCRRCRRARPERARPERARPERARPERPEKERPACAGLPDEYGAPYGI